MVESAIISDVDTIDREKIDKLVQEYIRSKTKQRLSSEIELHANYVPAQDLDGRSLSSLESGTKQWFYTYQTLQSQTCSSQPAIASGIMTDTCLVDVHRNDSSVFITCANSKFYFTDEVV